MFPPSIHACSGSSYVNKSQEIEGLSQMFVSEKAPRSGVGVAANGSLFLLQVSSVTAHVNKMLLLLRTGGW